jgi:hypothetical protein
MLGCLTEYRNLQRTIYHDLKSEMVTNRLFDIFVINRKSLSKANRHDLKSKVQGKEYFAFELSGKLSRAVNKSLFCEEESLADFCAKVL